MHRAILLSSIVLLAAFSAAAADKMRFWNLTAEEIDELYLAPAGTDQWGPNQCLNDDDKSVEADERLDLKDVKPGRYDVKLKDAKGRQCLVKNVEVKAGGKYAFSIQEKELKDCTQ
ncbi:MAG TPA: hypothetical protein VLV76_17670 [Candidatus Acidoferrum sp.]|nr:hypothetical protein [Candidatus Acidoferrum sp.]